VCNECEHNVNANDHNERIHHESGFVLLCTLKNPKNPKSPSLKAELVNHFEVNDLGQTTFLLGINILRDLDQQKIYLE
jgi:hypothetical protein